MYFNGEKLYSDKNFHFGGTNLITGTSNFDGFQINTPTNGYCQLQSSKDFFGNQQVLISREWISPTKAFNVFAGETICFSAVIQAKDLKNPPILAVYAGDAKYGGTATADNNTQSTNNLMYVDNNSSYIDDANSAQAYQPHDTNQHVVYGFFKITSSGTITPRLESSNAAEWLISSFKAELGTIKTSWSPAPQDMATKSDVTSLQDQINQLKNQIKS